MGAWGPKLYDNDVSLDVKEEYIELLRKGRTNEEATAEIINSNLDFIEDNDDGPIFWFALADIQWKYGRLSPKVKREAIRYIDEYDNLTQCMHNFKMYKQRKQELEELKERLNSPQPSEKKITIPKSYKCDWQMGDIYAYRLESEVAKEHGLYGRYLIFIKVDETVYHPQHIIPIVRVKISEDDKLPDDINKIETLKYVQTGIKVFDIGGPLDLECYEQFELNLKQEVNKKGYIPVYQLKLINTSKRIIPRNLIYIDNYTNFTSPKLEYIPENKLEAPGYIWKYFDKCIIEDYTQFNMKKSEIYNVDYLRNRIEYLKGVNLPNPQYFAKLYIDNLSNRNQ